MDKGTYQRGFHDYYRGEIYYADLNPVFGHEQGGVRPVLILQNDVGNYYSPTVIVTALTQRLQKKPKQRNHVVLGDIEGLEGESVFMLEYFRTLDKRRLKEYVGKLTEEQMGKIEEALKISLGLGPEDFLPREMEAP